VNAQLTPAVQFLKYDDTGAPYLSGFRCKECGEIFMADRRACPKCFSVSALAAYRLSTRGKLYNYTIVQRSFQGIPVPFVSAIVDLEGGGTLMGNLVDVEPNTNAIKFDMPIDVVFRDAGRTDKAGNHYLAYFFVPGGKV